MTEQENVKFSSITRNYTSKQMGDACEMLVAAELTLAGIPALKMPDNWRDYDVIALPFSGYPQFISVKSRTYTTKSHFVSIWTHEKFDWLAVVILNTADAAERAIYIIPRKVVLQEFQKPNPGTKDQDERYWSVKKMDEKFSQWRNNFKLSSEPSETLVNP